MDYDLMELRMRFAQLVQEFEAFKKQPQSHTPHAYCFTSIFSQGGDVERRIRILTVHKALHVAFKVSYLPVCDLDPAHRETVHVYFVGLLSMLSSECNSFRLEM